MSAPSVTSSRFLNLLITAGLVGSFAGCGGAPPRPRQLVSPEVAESPVRVQRPRRTRRHQRPQMEVAGTRSSLSVQETQQTMNPHMDRLAHCFRIGRRHRHVGGRIRMKIAVDGAGHVLSAHPDLSTVGNRRVERCVSDIVQSVRFPDTRGGGRVELQWSFVVDPLVREPAIWSPERVAHVVQRRSRSVQSQCRARQSIQVTAYVTRRGRILSAGAASNRHVDFSVLDCVAAKVKRWRMPRARRITKVTFSL